MNTSPNPPPERKRPAHFAAVESHNRPVIYFVTICTKDRRPLLATDDAHRVILDSWRAATWFGVGRYVLMPDHLHLFCAPTTSPPESLARWVAFWKSHSARNWPVSVSGGVWQRDYWDRQLRTGDSYTGKWEYVRNNPVRAGLVSRAEEWKYQGELNTLWWFE